MPPSPGGGSALVDNMFNFPFNAFGHALNSSSDNPDAYSSSSPPVNASAPSALVDLSSNVPSNGFDDFPGTDICAYVPSDNSASLSNPHARSSSEHHSCLPNSAAEGAFALEANTSDRSIHINGFYSNPGLSARAVSPDTGCCVNHDSYYMHSSASSSSRPVAVSLATSPKCASIIAESISLLAPLINASVSTWVDTHASNYAGSIDAFCDPKVDPDLADTTTSDFLFMIFLLR